MKAEDREQIERIADQLESTEDGEFPATPLADVAFLRNLADSPAEDHDADLRWKILNLCLRAGAEGEKYPGGAIEPDEAICPGPLFDSQVAALRRDGVTNIRIQSRQRFTTDWIDLDEEEGK